MATLTLNGLYNYDSTIFDGFRLPKVSDLDPSIETKTNLPILSKQIAIEKIVFDTLGLSLCYPSADDMKRAITNWTDTMFDIWVEMYQTMCYRYNAIWNKDGVIIEEHEGSYQDENSGTGTTNVTGYDSTSFSPYTQDVGSGTTEGTDRYKNTRTEKGNIGITTTQQMIKEQREVAGFSLYQYISDDFKHRFCIMVY